MQSHFSSDPDQTRGRLFPEQESAFRTVFQRDRDRIIHCSAFRRLKHKTQVFVEHEGDYFRTRLTHSIEVAQVARTIAGVLGLNVELTEAVALAHDLGHPPFGHTGEDALNRLMTSFGGFDHNAQAVRIVTKLEQHYADFQGLNLTWDTLEGIAKHNGPVLGDLPYALAEYNDVHDLELAGHASAEAQVAALADDIAYNNHDLHDGLRAQLFELEELCDLPLLDVCFQEVDKRYPRLNAYTRQHEVLRRFFGVLVKDVIKTTHKIVDDLRPDSVHDIRSAGQTIVQFSPELWSDLKVIREFLFTRMYRAPRVVEMRERVTNVVEALFPLYLECPDLLPDQWYQGLVQQENKTDLARTVADYISGMTDRFALQEYERLIENGEAQEAKSN